jgi:hypothetical protein
MARIRTIKPEFFVDADLCELSPLHRLLFQGLWCQADRDGKLEDKPRELKVKVLPYDDCNVDQLLEDLAAAGFIVRYAFEYAVELGTKGYIYIPTFKRHQNPHVKEAPSVIPDPPEPGASLSVLPTDRSASTGQAQGSHGASREEGKGREGKDPGREGKVPGQAGPGKPPASPAGHPPRLVHPPKSPPSAWTGMDFWAWAQHTRQEAKLAPEREPRIEALGGWWNGVRMLVGDVEAVKEAFFRFGEDEYWQKKRPPLPFAAFMQQWEKYLPRGAGGPHAAT